MSDLVHHLARFARALRDRGIDVSLSDEADGLAALTLVDLGDRDEVRRALRAALKVRPRDIAAFEELFQRLWSARDESAARPPRNPPVIDPTKPPRPAPRRHAPPPPASGAQSRESVEVRQGEEPGWSPEAILRRKPFEECTPADLAAMEPLVARLALSLATRRSRRRRPVRGRGEVDLRRSFRRAVGQGGEFLSLARRARPIERPRLVALCDTSGSMDPHARFFLAFVLALSRVARGTEVFAFNTALVRLTPHLRPGGIGGIGGSLARGDRIGGPLARLVSAVPDWSGGTRIGECLAEFVDRHLEPLVGADTVVLILSDGLDRGDLSPLARSMRALRARARRVLWLNPLAGDPRYEPTARAMAAALPYVDRLLPAHDLESLARLLPLVA